MIVFEGPDSGALEDIRSGPIYTAVRESLRREHASRRVVGLIAPTGNDLIEAWQACVMEGREPIILHFPTPKLSRIFWQSEITHAIESVGVDLLICANEACVPSGPVVPAILLDTLPRPLSSELCTEDEPFGLPDDGAFRQMSSGTTGFRKGIRFTFGQVRNHVEQYNKVLGLTSDDCIVSWLPLYHDMGFVATFLLPQFIGCKLVLMDPMDWVRRPEMLWDVIDRHHGTVCYMPNFGYEIMASVGRIAPLASTMRWWISCSEPTRPETMKRFVKATGAEPSTLSNCWGMAENIFAVCQSSGIRTEPLDGVEVASCGKPIPGVEVKSIDGEIYVRSAYSLREYLGADIVLDGDGFYATGDLGAVIDGEVYLQGRRHDVMINGGRKAWLSDLDFAVGEEIPESAGRIAAFGVFSPTSGTETPVVLIEHPEFWRKNRDAELRRRIIARTGIETTQAHFVPPRFITKTSSGKINRKITRQNWLKRQSFNQSERPASSASNVRDEIADLFPSIDFDKPLSDQIDSLAFVNLSLVLSKHGMNRGLRPDAVLREVLASPRREQRDAEDGEVIRIVSICDSDPFRLATPLFEKLLKRISTPIQFKHVCVPPLAILLSDLIFSDYFMCRDDRTAPYEALTSALAELRSASVIIVDDACSIFWPRAPKIHMIYPKISHDFQSDAAAKLLALRWMGYSGSHHLISTTLVPGETFRPEQANASIRDLSEYLETPVIRVAYGDKYPEVTADWEVHCGTDTVAVASQGKYEGIDPVQFQLDLGRALAAVIPNAPKRRGEPRRFIDFNDQPHWCSWLANPALVDFILEHFRDIIVLGKPSSMPYMAEQAATRGVRLRYRPGLDVPEDCDCVVQTGSWGKPKTSKPIFQVMGAGWLEEPADNLPPELAAICPPNRVELRPQ